MELAVISGTVTLLRVLILWVPEEHNWRRQFSKWNVCERSHAYIIKHANVGKTQQLAPCDGINWHQVQWHSYMYWFCECQSWRTGDGWSQWIVWGRAVSCYIIKHPIETQLTPCDGIHWYQVQWHYYVVLILWVPESTTGGRMVSKWIVWGEQSHAYIIKHPIETQLAPCDGIHWHQVTVTFYMYDSVSARAGELGTDGLQMNCVRESSLIA